METTNPRRNKTMTFAEKLKTARKNAGMSQDALAEKLGVSRQAVTKWETGRGIPDIENMMIISNLFGISVDEFLSSEKEAAPRKGFLYESRTEYDIDGKKHFDMNLGSASELRIIGNDGEKIVVTLGSNDKALEEIAHDFKVKIDDGKGCADIDIHRQKEVKEAIAKTSLVIEISLPNRYLSDIEAACNCGTVSIFGITCEDFEVEGKISNLKVDEFSGCLEIDSNLDMAIEVGSFEGSVEINQISATSRLSVKEGVAFRGIAHGRSVSISYEDENGNACDDFSDTASGNVIELAGSKSELVISRR